MTNKPVLIFDLDGTLIDSAPSVISSLHKVLDEADLTSHIPITNSLIGLPLQETLSILTGINDPTTLQIHIESFKGHYDSDGYKKTLAYPGIGALLATLHESEFSLHLATNKRYTPTKLILEYLGWHDLFQTIYTLDLYHPRALNKSSLLKSLLLEQNIRPTSAIYIGDKEEDACAAEQNNLKFYGVSWGYGNFADTRSYAIVNSTADLLEKLNHDKISSK